MSAAFLSPGIGDLPKSGDLYDIFPGDFLNLGTFIPGIEEFENLGIFKDL